MGQYTINHENRLRFDVDQIIAKERYLLNRRSIKEEWDEGLSRAACKIHDDWKRNPNRRNTFRWEYIKRKVAAL